MYRQCVGVVLFNSKGLVFVGQRIDTPDAWQMPQGGIDEGESVEEAAFRELEEETGIDADRVEIIRIHGEKLRYRLPRSLLIERNLWNGKYEGQEQTWVAMRFKGDDSDINLNAHEEPEFSSWKWVKLDEAPDLIVPFKREVYKQVVSAFADIVLPSLHQDE